MFARFMPREGRFFDLFNEHAAEIVQGAEVLRELLAALGHSHEDVAKKTAELDAIESKADDINDETINLLHSTFITPLDRDEIHLLISRMDDVLDTMQDAAGTVALYDIRRAIPEAMRFADIILDASRAMQKALLLLNDMDNGPAILTTCREISRLESEADQVLRDAISHLFREEPDVRELIKLKAAYELLETVTDICKNVANILEGIVLENS
ncbi:Conserved hypothetical protein [gamma proteobacterium HdN1]|nr:Conserved hypothetical protein [gamma proteobacterium HdN1]